ncbi:elongation factor G [Ferrovibrio sp.]|uniref:elongation factor G n=1 Tax=Ferrovibrio sp. TaxID=1917215 RepID=UPI0035B23B38
METKPQARPRVAALVGPYTTGKTSLLEALAFAAGAIPRKGNAMQGFTLGDASPEAKAHRMTVEPNLASLDYLNESWSFIDCPGSVELTLDSQAALMVADIAIVVVEPDPDRVMTLAPLLKFLDERRIPHLLFVNKMDKADIRLRDMVAALQMVSARPLVLREVPIRDGDRITGYIDLVSQRAYRWRENAASDRINAPDAMRPREVEARQAMLETIADFDDALLADLLEDRMPEPYAIYAQLTRDLQGDLIVPVFFGAAERGNGVLRLLKALRHEAPEPSETAARLGIDLAQPFAASVFKTLHQPHTGKLSLCRIWCGSLQEGAHLQGRRMAGMLAANGGKLSQAQAGQIVGIQRLEDAATGDLLGLDSRSSMPDWPQPPSPLMALAIAPADRKDDVKLSAALARLLEEDRALSLAHEAGALLLRGQGEVHLKLAIERLQSRFNVSVTAQPPACAYRETIRHGISQHARFKRQSGGHGQFADVKVEIAPRKRGEGYLFVNRVTGGAIPKNFIPAVDAGVQEALQRGPLGFPVVDVMVTLLDGQFHAVDSSDQAFRTAGGMAMHDGLPECSPVLLEPIMAVLFHVPNAFTAKVHAIASSRRGQILGMNARPGWEGWDEILCHLPESEMSGLATELRSATLGVGSFEARFDHLQELAGRLADRVVEDRRRAAQAA